MELITPTKKTETLPFSRNGRKYSHRCTKDEARSLKEYAKAHELTNSGAINNLIDKALTGLQSENHKRRLINTYVPDLSDVNVKLSLRKQLLRSLASEPASFEDILSFIISLELNLASNYRRKGRTAKSRWFSPVTWYFKEWIVTDSIGKLYAYGSIHKKRSLSV